MTDVETITEWCWRVALEHRVPRLRVLAALTEAHNDGLRGDDARGRALRLLRERAERG